MLQRRPTGYYYRQRVPQDLRAILGKGEAVKSLGTKDLAEAKSEAKRVAREVR